MEPLIIEGTAKTPTVNFNASEGLIEIKGRSIPENSIEFYKPLVDWLDEYAKSPAPHTTVNNSTGVFQHQFVEMYSGCV